MLLVLHLLVVLLQVLVLRVLSQVYPVVWLVVNILDTDAIDVRTKLLFLREINPLMFDVIQVAS